MATGQDKRNLRPSVSFAPPALARDETEEDIGAYDEGQQGGRKLTNAVASTSGNGNQQPASMLVASLQRRVRVSESGHASSRASRNASRVTSRQGSRATSRQGSRVPSRQGSRATSRQGSRRHSRAPSYSGASFDPDILAMWELSVAIVEEEVRATSAFHTLRDMRAEDRIKMEQLEILKELGQGAFGIVQQALYRPKDGNPCLVAVKKLKENLVVSPEDLRNFLKEVALLRKLRERNIVECIGFGYEDSPSRSRQRQTLYLVTEYMPGGTLKALVLRQMRNMGQELYTNADALRWCIQIAQGLKYLHAAHPQVIHRDLKLENILLDREDLSEAEAKLTDFGLSALVTKTTAPKRFMQPQSPTSPTDHRSDHEICVAFTAAASRRQQEILYARSGRGWQPAVRHGEAASAAHPAINGRTISARTVTFQMGVAEAVEVDSSRAAVDGSRAGSAAKSNASSSGAAAYSVAMPAVPAMSLHPRGQAYKGLDSPSSAAHLGSTDQVLPASTGGFAVAPGILYDLQDLEQGQGQPELNLEPGRSRTPSPPQDAAFNLPGTVMGSDDEEDPASAHEAAVLAAKILLSGTKSSSLGCDGQDEFMISTKGAQEGRDTHPSAAPGPGEMHMRQDVAPVFSATAAVSRGHHSVPLSQAPNPAAYNGPLSPYLPTVTEDKHLSGRTGTLMYMSPEVYKMQPYNEKTDVFSFAMCCYELMHRYLMSRTIAQELVGGDYELYVQQVCKGYRPPIDPKLPPELKGIITDCWSQDPKDRPSMDTVVDRLRALEDSGLLEALDAQQRQKAKASKGCCAIS